MTADRLSRKTVSLDCDTLYFSNVLASFRDFPAGVSSSFHFTDDGDKPVFSYLELDDEGMISDIREKVPISKHANTGGYAFASGSLLRKYCMQVLDEAVGTAGEFYTSCVIKKMLDDGHKFKGLHVPDFACVGTPWQLTTFLQRIARNEVKSARKMRFVFDLDNTLVTHPRVHGDYSTCEPKDRNVQLVQELSAAGHYIIIWTARRMRTHKANVGAVIKDVGLITLQSLAKCGIPYDELHFGKPNADLYVDDLAVNALVDTEKEIGWACKSTEEAPRVLPGMIAARSFNNVVVVDGTVIKSSKRETISGEVYYYRSLPPALLHLFPKVLSIEESMACDVSSISMERVKGVPLSHLVVAHALTPGRLLKFLTALEKLHTASPLSVEAAAAAGLNVYSNYAAKVQERYSRHSDTYKQFPEAADICAFLVAHLTEYEAQNRGVLVKYIHGDPVFSNILLTSSNDTFFIDMRGRVGDVHTTSGDVLYDLGKVYQSLYGYDFILLNGGSTNRVQEDYLRTLRGAFQGFLKSSAFYSPIIATRMRDLEVITASLYFSLIPLHANDAKLPAYMEKALRLMHDSGEDEAAA